MIKHCVGNVSARMKFSGKNRVPPRECLLADRSACSSSIFCRVQLKYNRSSGSLCENARSFKISKFFSCTIFYKNWRSGEIIGGTLYIPKSRCAPGKISQAKLSGFWLNRSNIFKWLHIIIFTIPLSRRVVSKNPTIGKLPWCIHADQMMRAFWEQWMIIQIALPSTR